MNRNVKILREVISKLVPMIAARGIKVTQRGAKAYVATDPRTLKPVFVNIPHVPDDADDALILAIQGFIDHECGHVLDTDWKHYCKGKSTGAKIEADRGAGPEGQKIGGDRLDNLLNIVEDPFVERCMQKRFPGTAYNLDRLYEVFLGRITKKALDEIEAKPGITEEQRATARMSVLLVPIVRSWSGQRQFTEFLDKIDAWSDPLVEAFCDQVPDSVKKACRTNKTTAENLETAVKIYNILYPPPPPEPPASKEESEEGDKGKSSSKSSSSSSSSKSDGKGSPKDKPEAEDDKGSKLEAAEKEEGDEPGKDGKEDKSDERSEDEKDEEGPGDSDESEDEKSDEEEGASGEDEDEDEEEGASSEAEEDEEDEPAEDSGSDSSDDAGEDDGSESVGTSGDEAEGEAEAKPGTDEREKRADKPSPFLLHVVETDERDLSKAIAKIITDDATRDIKEADYRVFTRDFDVIEPFPADSCPDQYLVDLDTKTRHMVGPMQKEIERMMAAQSRVVNQPGLRSGRINASALSRLRVADDRVFRRKIEHRSKATAVSLLIDNSGSMGGYFGRLGTAMSAGYALSQTLDRVNIPHEVLGFTTKGYGPKEYHEALEAEEERIGIEFSRHELLYMPIYKGFNDRFTPEIRKRFAMGSRGGFTANNIDGEAVEIATNRLAARTEPRKVLLVLSDGQPACYSRFPAEIHASLHRSVEVAVKRGIELVGIGIQTDAVRTYYPKHVVLNDLESLPKTVMGELKRILLK